MTTLWAASARHLLRRPAQLALALLALSAGVATVVAVDIATASSRRAFELSLSAVNGAATHMIVGGPQGVPEELYARLVTRAPLRGGPAPVYAPLVEGYVTAEGRVMQLVGVDPFATRAMHGPQSRLVPRAGGGAGRLEALRRWFLEPGAVVMAARTAKELRLRSGSDLVIDVGGVRHAATLIGLTRRRGAADESLLLTDIAQAQEWLGLNGRLTRIDVREPQGAPGRAALARLRRRLPPGVALERAAGHTRRMLDLTHAFTTNLEAMSLLALLVSTLLIYGAISFTVVQRRRSMGILRALGATRRQILALVLAEAAVLGVAGAGLGLLLGIGIGRELVRFVAGTINDLYFVVTIEHTTLPLSSLLEAFAAGLGASLLAALLPALEVAGGAPELGLRRSALEQRAADTARRLLWVSVALAAAAVALIAGSGRSVPAGFAALLLLLSSAAALTPAVLRALASASARALGGVSTVARLALGDIAGSLSRTGIAVAALAVAVAAMIGVSVMVESFRLSLREWLIETMRADIYVSAQGPATQRPELRIEPAVLRALVSTPGIAGYSASRSVEVRSARGGIVLDALRMAPGSYAGVRLRAGDPSKVWAAFHRGAILVSDSLAWRLRLAPGDRLALLTATGLHEFPVAAVFKQYGSGRGSALISMRQYRRWWDDDAITALGLYLERGVAARGEIERLRAAGGARQALFIRSNAGIRALSLEIFDRAFAITRVLYWLAAAIAAVGLLSALLAWQLERAHQVSLLRALGLTARGAAALVASQTAFMGLAALAAAIPTGLLIAFVLTEVVDRRAFGWRIEMHLRGAPFGNALALSLAAAAVAALYPAWRSLRSPIAAELREE